MKTVLMFLTLLMLCGVTNAQWEVWKPEPLRWQTQTVETFDSKYRVASVMSNSRKETLSIVYPMNDKWNKSTDPYDHLYLEISLNYNIEENTLYEPVKLLFRFNDNSTIYTLNVSSLRGGWNATSKKYIIRPLILWFNVNDGSSKGVDDGSSKEEKIPYHPGMDFFDTGAEDFITLVKIHQKLFCRLITSFIDNEKIYDFEFTLQNSTDAINYLFREN